jgi:uncharacterized protein YndB with AHSA1/START domain
VIEGDAVVHEVLLPAPREAVFDMFVVPERLVLWLGISADLEPRPGGRFRFEVVPGQFCEGRYVTVERPARLVVTWGWTDPGMGLPPGTSRVEVELSEDEGGTRLRLVHRRLPGELRPIHDEGWTRFLARLADVAAGRDPGARPEGDPRARRAALDAETRP